MKAVPEIASTDQFLINESTPQLLSYRRYEFVRNLSYNFRTLDTLGFFYLYKSLINRPFMTVDADMIARIHLPLVEQAIFFYFMTVEGRTSGDTSFAQPMGDNRGVRC